jgi:hypothetical protein
MAERKGKEKETKKIISDDVEKFFRDVWGKVVDYACMGAEEASKFSSTAKTRVDIETLKFKRGKIVRMLGERYWDLCEKDSSLVLAGTREIMREIRGIDKEIADLEKEASKAKKPVKKEPAKKTPAKAATPKRKVPAQRKAPVKKADSGKSTTKKTPAQKPAAKTSKPTEDKE